jgi:hypothetical protein
MSLHAQLLLLVLQALSPCCPCAGVLHARLQQRLLLGVLFRLQPWHCWALCLLSHLLLLLLLLLHAACCKLACTPGAAVHVGASVAVCEQAISKVI